MTSKTVYYQTTGLAHKPKEETNTKRVPPPIEPPQVKTIQETQSDVPKCVCDERAKAIACIRCGYYRKGLFKQVKCAAHPNVQFLMAINKCPYCGCRQQLENDLNDD